MVLREWSDNKRMSVAHDARHDRKSNFCDFFWRMLLITHGGGRMNSRIACTKPLGGETLVSVVSVGFFSGVEVGLDILALSGYA
jgi:hypothetical protein